MKTLIILFLTLPLLACEKDSLMDRTGDALEDAGDAIGDTIEDARDEIEDALE